MKTYKFKQKSYNNLGAEFRHNRQTYMLGFNHTKDPVLYCCSSDGEPICEVPVNDSDIFTGFDSANWAWADIVEYYANNKAVNGHLPSAFNNMFR